MWRSYVFSLSMRTGEFLLYNPACTGRAARRAVAATVRVFVKTILTVVVLGYVQATILKL